MLSLLRKHYFNKLVAANLYCQHQKAISALSTLKYSTEATDYKNERREFMAVYPDLVKNLTEYASKYQPKEAVKLYEKVLQYNVIGRSQFTGIFTVLAFKELADKAQLNSDNIKLAQYLGWCVNMKQNAYFIADDVMDGSVTRCGQPCWHMLEEIGLTAINDSSMVLNGAFHILKENFSQKEYYVKLLELFHEVILISTFGQSMDLQASKGDVSSFTMDRYKSIAENKTSYYALYLPIASAMHLYPDVYKETKATLLELGHIAQVLNDFNDCFGDPEKTGKIGTDIQENKCTWLAVVCMEIASEAQKGIMRECYGKSDPVKIAQVKHLYEELGLPSIFTTYKEEAYNKIIKHSQQNSGGISSRFYKILAPLISRKAQADLIGSSYNSA